MNTIYVRTLKRAEHTVFCVENGQKTYFDLQFQRSIPYSSGQQIKRSLVDSLNEILNVQGSPTTFIFDLNKKNELKEGEVYATCNPSYADQLFGGWMKAGKGGKERTLKRRSPLSISAMRALHPLLAGTSRESLSFDRSDRANNKVIVRDANGNALSPEEITKSLEGKDRSLTRKWIPPTARATGLFVQDIAIDLRRLFSISLNPYEPEVTKATEEHLRAAGWVEGENVFGKCLTAPASLREKWIPAICSAIVNWRITSNQSRTFSLMETLAVALSNDANKMASSIRAKLSEDEKAVPVIEEEGEGVDLFITLPAAGYLTTSTESATALDEARSKLQVLISSFDFENQLQLV